MDSSLSGSERLTYRSSHRDGRAQILGLNERSFCGCRGGGAGYADSSMLRYTSLQFSLFGSIIVKSPQVDKREGHRSGKRDPKKPWFGNVGIAFFRKFPKDLPDSFCNNHLSLLSYIFVNGAWRCFASGSL